MRAQPPLARRLASVRVKVRCGKVEDDDETPDPQQERDDESELESVAVPPDDTDDDVSEQETSGPTLRLVEAPAREPLQLREAADVQAEALKKRKRKKRKSHSATKAAAQETEAEPQEESMEAEPQDESMEAEPQEQKDMEDGQEEKTEANSQEEDEEEADYSTDSQEEGQKEDAKIAHKISLSSSEEDQAVKAANSVSTKPTPGTAALEKKKGHSLELGNISRISSIRRALFRVADRMCRPLWRKALGAGQS